MSRRGPRPAQLPPAGLPGLRTEWSRLVEVTDSRLNSGETHTWHVLDSGLPDRSMEPKGTLLCVHGNPTWSYLWRRLLAEPPPGWRVLAPDQLGMGWSDGTARPRTVAERIADLGDLVSALEITGPVVTVGHDWGGVISLGWALTHREQLRGVVLTNTAVALTEADKGPALIRLAHLAGLREAVCRRTPVFVRAATVLSQPPLPRDVRDAFAAPYRSPVRRAAVAEFVADIPFSPGHPSAERVDAVATGTRSLDVPVLLLWGPRDPVFSERYLADLRARLPQASLHRYEGASHLVTEDAPGYAGAVRDWVADLDQAPRVTAIDEPPEQAGVLEALRARATDPDVAIAEVGGHTVSWAQLAERVDRLAAGLAAAGMEPGHRVALLVPPSAELTTVLYAVWRAGGVVVVADRGLGLRGMRRALRSAAADHVVGEAPGLVAARLMGLPGSRIAATTVAPSVARRLGARPLQELLQLGDTASMPAPPTSEQESAVLFTSGATGPAKGVVYRHRQAGAQIELLRKAYGISERDRLVAAFAPFALLGPALGVATAVPAIDVTAPQTLTAPLLADAIAAVEATVVFAAPAALRGVVASTGSLSSRQRSALQGVRLLVSAGAPVPASLLRSVLTVLPHAEAHTPYGMTEALPVTDISLTQIKEAGAGNGVCVGAPLPGVDIAVSPLDGLGRAEGALTDSAEVTGEICVSGPHVKERYDALWATERASARNPGWHRTADVGHLDAQGRLWVEGRLAHVVTTAAGPVTPVGVEQRVEALDGVETAAVVGVGPAGTQVVAVVVIPSKVGTRGRLRLGAGPVADPGLTEAVRTAAGVSVAAVLVTSSLPVDIRHASKIDRRAVAGWASRILQGGGRVPRHP